LGKAPSHWEICALKRVAALRSGDSITAEQIAEQGEYPVYGGNGRRGFTSNYTHEGSYALIGRQGALCGNINYAHGKFWASEHAVVVTPTKNVDTFWLGETLRAMNLNQYSASAAQPGLSVDTISRLMIPLPPLNEQSAIAEFLSLETHKIDALITEQERLVALLAEKRQSTVCHAVTHGLNTSVETKDSGVPWLGRIPAHWGVCQSRRLFAVRSEPALPSDRMLTASQKYGVLFQSDFIEMESRRVVEVIMGVESLKHVEPDDFIISMRSFQGGIEWCKLRGSTSFHYVIIKPVKEVHPPFFAHLLKSLTYIQALRATTDLIRDGQELRYSNFAQVDLPLVPLDEQRAIAEFLDGELSKLDELSDEAVRAIELLKERRSALVWAAVTGQIDVRKAVASVSANSALAA
jgi:type I restriction enzyme S subunit